MDKSDLYINEDGTAYAVLISPGFGAGWSSWEGKKLAYDRRVIELFLSGYKVPANWYTNEAPKADWDRFFRELGYGHVYAGGWNALKLVWMPFGTYWRIKEYDSSETIEYLDIDNDYICFNS